MMEVNYFTLYYSKEMVNPVLTHSVSQTQKLGEKLAKKIMKTANGKRAAVLALEGELGSGKTTFLQGFTRGLGVKEKILSPTFIIIRKLQIPNSKSQTNFKFKIKKFKTFYHIDCYRIKSPKEILDLGFKKIISSPHNIAAVEWAERLKKNLPRNSIKIKFNFIDKNTREITFIIPKRIRALSLK